MDKHTEIPDGWRALKIDGFMDLVGPLLKSTDSGTSNQFALQMRDEHLNAIGLVHGGVVTGFLDQALALATWEAIGRKPAVTVQMDTRFMNAAKSGDFLRVQASISHETRSMVFAQAHVSCDDKLIASANAVMKILKKADA